MDKNVLKIVIILLIILLLVFIYGTYKGTKIKKDKKNANQETVLTEYMTKFVFESTVL